MGLELPMEAWWIAAAGGGLLLVVLGFLLWRRLRSSAVVEPEGIEVTQDPLRSGLGRTRSVLGARLAALFGRNQIDEVFFQELEEALIAADVGVRTSGDLIARLRDRVQQESVPADQLWTWLRELVVESLGEDKVLAPITESPWVILVVGVNGSGKTTTIGKLAARLSAEGKQVLLGAGDTFRAGAIEQLRIWAQRTGSEIVSHAEGADPSAVLFDALKAAQARSMDVVICDTAGRLQTKGPLMDELEKVRRVVGKAVPGAPHEVLLVLDATIGQNAISQARVFGEVAGVTGVVLTKLDGTARGGVVVAVASELGLPVKFVGVGEQVEDLRPFQAEPFVQAMLAPPEA